MVSDLHLGARTEVDVLRRPEARDSLLAAVSGVDRLVLHKNVAMFLYVDSRSGFLGTPRDGQRAGS